MIFSRFLTKKFHTRSPAERKNDFHPKILLETCSATSNYPRNLLSCHQNKYCGLQMKKLKKIEQIPHFSALFGGVLLQFLYNECWCPTEIFSRTPKSATMFTKSHFSMILKDFLCKISWKLLKNVKNRHQLTFARISCHCDVLRCFHLLWEIDILA